MAKPPKSKFEVNEMDPNDGFNNKRAKFSRLELRYRIVNNGYEFHYRKETSASPDDAGVSDRIRRKPFILFFKDGKTVGDPLDIGIKDEDTIVEVATVAQDDGTFPELYWSRVYEAVHTGVDRKGLYGHLRYSADGVTWEKFEDYYKVHPKCRLIRFKAALNRVDNVATSHKFSYFVLLNDTGNKPLEYEIDPDIKNPSS